VSLEFLPQEDRFSAHDRKKRKVNFYPADGCGWPVGVHLPKTQRFSGNKKTYGRSQRVSGKEMRKINKSRVYAVALHDVKVSGGDETVRQIEFVKDSLKLPVTVHLVCDRLLSKDSALGKYLVRNIKNKSVEVVFHGIHHACERKVWRWLSWYHKYQAEYLVDSESLRAMSKKQYANLAKISGYNPGICTPCWLSNGRNRSFLNSLAPSFYEMLLHMSADSKKRFSTVISIGSDRSHEAFFLKLLGWMLCAVSLVKKNIPVRVAIHVCDLKLESSMVFFKKITESFDRRKYRAVLMRNLV
jgi:hypothetical protein